MRRVLGALAVLIAVVVAVAAIWLYGRLTSLEAERVGDAVHVIFGTGGNVGVLETSEGAVVVDTLTFRFQGARVRELAAELGGGPVQAVLNTHYHQDHTHGNPGFAPGTRVVATGRTLDYLRFFDAAYWEGAAAGTLPNDRVEDVHELRIGGKTIRSHHLGRGHTGGDLVVLFVEDGVVHTGDLFFNGRYPFVDLKAGGSLPAWIATLDRVLALEFDRVIPGHGPVTDREGILGFQRFLSEVWEAGRAAADEGLSLEETLARARLTEDAGYEPGGLPPFVTVGRDDVLQWAWEEATGSVVPAEVPRADSAAGEEQE